MFSRSATTITSLRISHSTARRLAFLILKAALPAGTCTWLGSQPLSVTVIVTASGAMAAASAWPSAGCDRLAAAAAASAKAPKREYFTDAGTFMSKYLWLGENRRLRRGAARGRAAAPARTARCPGQGGRGMTRSHPRGGYR